MHNVCSDLPFVMEVQYFVSAGIKRTRKVNHAEPPSLEFDVPEIGVHCDAVEPISHLGPTLSRHKVHEAAFTNSNSAEKEKNAVRIPELLELLKDFPALYQAEVVLELRVHSSPLPRSLLAAGDCSLIYPL